VSCCTKPVSPVSEMEARRQSCDTASRRRSPPQPGFYLGNVGAGAQKVRTATRKGITGGRPFNGLRAESRSQMQPSLRAQRIACSRRHAARPGADLRIAYGSVGSRPDSPPVHCLTRPRSGSTVKFHRALHVGERFASRTSRSESISRRLVVVHRGPWLNGKANATKVGRGWPALLARAAFRELRRGPTHHS